MRTADASPREYALDTYFRGRLSCDGRSAMRANDVRSTEATHHGAYVCLSVPPDARPVLASTAVPALADRLGLRNEFEPRDEHPPEAIAFLRRVSATPADIADD